VRRNEGCELWIKMIVAMFVVECDVVDLKGRISERLHVLDRNDLLQVRNLTLSKDCVLLRWLG
jgi:hypothetical protein